MKKSIIAQILFPFSVIGLFLGTGSSLQGQSSGEIFRTYEETPAEFYPFMPEMVFDPRLRDTTAKWINENVILVLPPLNLSGKGEYDWIRDAIAHALAGRLRLIKYVPARNKPLVAEQITPVRRNGKALYPVINLKRYLEADRRDRLEKILEKEKAAKRAKQKQLPIPLYAPQNPAPVGYETLETRIFSQWSEFLLQRSLSLLPEKTDEKVLRQSEAYYLFHSLYREQWQTIYHTLGKYIVLELKKVRNDANVHIYLLGGNYRLDASERHAMQIRDPMHRKQTILHQKIRVEIHLYDLNDNRVVWSKSALISAAGNWKGILALADSAAKEFYPPNRATADLSKAPPGFSVYIDDEYYGKTPLKVDTILPGIHSIRLIKDGFERKEHWFSIGASESLPLDIHPKKTKYGNSVDINGTDGARLFFDGMFIGSIPLTMTNVPPGPHRIRAESSGYIPAERSLIIEANSDHRVKMRLRPEKRRKRPAEREYMVYKPYRWFNLFRTGNDLEITSKYYLAASLLFFTSAIISDGLGKQRYDRTLKVKKSIQNPNAPYTYTFMTLGVGSVVASAAYLYLSMLYDDASFAQKGKGKNFWGDTYQANLSVDILSTGRVRPRQAPKPAMYFNFSMICRF